MGRSVSYPSEAVVAFQDVSSFGFTDEDGDLTEAYDEGQGAQDWEWFIEQLIEDAGEIWPSLFESDRWLGNEDHVLMENNHVCFGVSEYCGLVAVWIVVQEVCDYPGLAEHWIEQAKDKFIAKFGELQKIGTFSNGEGVYEKLSE